MLVPTGVRMSRSTKSLGAVPLAIVASAAVLVAAVLPMGPALAAPGDTYTLKWSESADRSSAADLEGAAVSTPLHVFVTPESDVASVEFSVDGAPVRTERVAPYDLGGTADGGDSQPFATGSLGDGRHTVSAEIRFPSGQTQTTSASFTLESTPAPSPPPSSGLDLVYSTSANRSSPKALDGASPSGEVYVFTTPDTGVTRVRFRLDGALARTESVAPYDLRGTAGDGSAQPFDLSTLDDGVHTVVAEVERDSGGTVQVSASFIVGTQDPPTDPPADPTFGLVYATAANRQGPANLDGATPSGNIYVFTSPDHRRLGGAVPRRRYGRAHRARRAFRPRRDRERRKRSALGHVLTGRRPTHGRSGHLLRIQRDGDGDGHLHRG